jgi:ABC-type Na+ efflux pump permease subunit
MTIQKAMLVFRKDWREISRNWQVLLPIVVIPFIFSILLPLIIIVLPGQAMTPGSSTNDFDVMMRGLPANVRQELSGMTGQQVLVYVMSLYFLAPFFLIIPLMASSVIASDSFAGEKERKTIEALLAIPMTDSDLLLGKVLVSFIPSIVVTFISFAAYSIIVDVLSFTLFQGRLLLPNVTWIMLIFGLAPTVALAGIGLTVMVSARVRGFREAQQISAMLLAPILALVFAQMAGAIVFGPTVIAALAAIFVVVDVLLFRVGLRLFKREEIMSRL